MKKRLTGVVLLWVCLLSKAQVTINVQLPPGGLVQKDALWNIVVINNSSVSEESIISLNVQDALTGQTVLSASSRSFILGKGVKVINIKDVQPLQYNFIAGELTGMFMPLGSYVACYRVLKNTEKLPEPLGDECVRIFVAPLSPPLLNMPADHAELQTNYPQFNWLPPTPSNMFSSLNYDLLVTEILPGQSAAEAILNNSPVYTNYNLRSTYQIYPSSFSRLKEGGQYAWQVTARNGLNYAAQTEVWSFTIKKSDSAKAAISTGSYIILGGKQQASGISTVSNEGGVTVRYYSFDKDHEASIRFLSAGGKELKKVKKKISYGNNLLQFKLNRQFEKGAVYIIELTDQKKNIYTAKFNIQ